MIDNCICFNANDFCELYNLDKVKIDRFGPLLFKNAFNKCGDLLYVANLCFNDDFNTIRIIDNLSFDPCPSVKILHIDSSFRDNFDGLSQKFPNLIAFFVKSIADPIYIENMCVPFTNVKYLYLGKCSGVCSLLSLKLDKLKMLFPSVIQIYVKNQYYDNLEDMFN